MNRRDRPLSHPRWRLIFELTCSLAIAIIAIWVYFRYGIGHLPPTSSDNIFVVIFAAMFGAKVGIGTWDDSRRDNINQAWWVLISTAIGAITGIIGAGMTLGGILFLSQGTFGLVFITVISANIFLQGLVLDRLRSDMARGVVATMINAITAWLAGALIGIVAIETIAINWLVAITLCMAGGLSGAGIGAWMYKRWTKRQI